MNADEFQIDSVANPFSTRHTRPGKLQFIYEPGWDAARIVQEFEQNERRGAIVGLHGSGKSTLLADIEPYFTARAQKVIIYVLHAGEKRWRRRREERWDAQTVVLIDGFEQLSMWSRWRLKAACRLSDAGLLVTSHQPVRGLPTLYQTSTNLPLAQTLAQQLLANVNSRISDTELESAFESCGGNLRELWFKLFDVYERKIR